jgi:hypothetical protein
VSPPGYSSIAERIRSVYLIRAIPLSGGNAEDRPARGEVKQICPSRLYVKFGQNVSGNLQTSKKTTREKKIDRINKMDRIKRRRNKLPYLISFSSS